MAVQLVLLQNLTWALLMGLVTLALSCSSIEYYLFLKTVWPRRGPMSELSLLAPQLKALSYPATSNLNSTPLTLWPTQFSHIPGNGKGLGNSSSVPT